MRHPALTRVVLAALGLSQAIAGVQALVAPAGFYRDFPVGRHWVAAYPSYSEHLVRDVGALFLATGALLVIAAVRLDRRVVAAALTSWLLYAVPHTTYHLLDLGPLGTGDAIAEAVALLVTVLLPTALLVDLARSHPRPAPSAR